MAQNLSTLDIHGMLDGGAAADEWLRSIGVLNTARALHNLRSIAEAGVTLDLMQFIADILARECPRLSDPDMAINNLERFFAASRSGLALAALFERDETAIPILLRIFATSQYLSDLLIRDPAAYDALRLTAGQPVSREILIDEPPGE